MCTLLEIKFLAVIRDILCIKFIIFYLTPITTTNLLLIAYRQQKLRIDSYNLFMVYHVYQFNL